MRARTTKGPKFDRAKFETRLNGVYGGGVISQPDPKTWKYDCIPTGSLELDWALGCGGYIRGRVTELWGLEQIGKSLLCLLAVASAQRVDRTRMVAWFDIENSFDAPWAVSLGVDMTRLDLIQPQDAEEVSDLVKELAETEQYSMIVLDSVGAMIGRKEREKDAEEVAVAIVAKIMTRMLNNALSLLRDTNTALLIINQVRANISGYGAETKASGGHSLRHNTTHRLHVKRTAEKPFLSGGDKGEKLGQEIAILVEKNRVAPANRVATIRLYSKASERYGPAGVDRPMEAWTLGSRLGIIEQRGSIYDLPDGTKGVKGKDAVMTILRDNHALVGTIRSKALAATSDQVATSLAEEK
jgi:recombination protein RecA